MTSKNTETSSLESGSIAERPLIIDGHCDTILDIIGEAWEGEVGEARDFLIRATRGHVDLPRLIEAGINCQAMALFTSNRRLAEARSWTWSLIEVIEAICGRTDKFRIVRSAAEIQRAKAEAWIAALLAIEGGEAIGESLEELRAFHGRGIRLMTLTWSRRNAIGRGVGVPGSDGLSDFGKRVVSEMENLGMIVDASHLSDEALGDLLSIAKRPIVASHSNCRALCDHRRNLTDRQIEGIASTGGLVAATFAGAFIDPDPAKVTWERFLDHVDHLVAVAGAEHVGIGSDFDGWREKFGVAAADCTKLGHLETSLLARGRTKEEAAMILGKNWLRVIGEIAG